MPPAVPVGALTVGQFIGLQAGIGFGMTALSYGLSYFTQRNKGVFGNENERNFQVNGSSTETYLPVLYGKSEIGINRIFIDTDPDNRDWLYFAGVFAHGIIDRVTKIKADGETIAAYNKSKKRWEVDDNYSGLVGSIETRRGSDHARHYSFIGDKFPEWTDDRRARGCASVAISIKYDQDKFKGGIPRITVVVRGNRLYDPRTPNDPKAYSNNLALAALDYLRGKRYGMRALDEEIDFDSFIAEANHCDETIEGDPIEAPAKCKPKIRKMQCKLDYGATYYYKITYLSAYSVNNSFSQDQTAASSAGNVTISNKKGRVTVDIPAPTDTNKAYIDKINIWRTEGDGSDYYLVRQLDYESEDDDNELSFVDNMSDEDLVKQNPMPGSLAWDTYPAVSTPPSAPTASFTAYTGSLTVGKYYRYKIIYGNANGHTQGGGRSKAIQAVKGKKVARLFDIDISDDKSIDWRAIYRTPGMTNPDDDIDDPATYPYKYLYTIDDNETEEYIDVTADASLGSGGGADSQPKGATLTPDTLPTTATITSGSQARYTFDGIIDCSKMVINNQEDILFCGLARLYLEGGKWRIHIKKPTVAETFELTEDNIIGDWDFDLPGADVLCNYVRASFINPKANEQTDYVTFPPKKNLNQYLIDHNRFEITKEIELRGVRDKRKAKRLAMISRNLANQSIPVSVKVMESALKARIGSVVKVTHSTPGWSGKKFWVEGNSIGPDGTIYSTLTEYFGEAFDLQYLNADPPDDTDSNLPDASEPPDGVIVVTITEEIFLDKTTLNWRLKVAFTNPAGPFWDYSSVYIKRGDEGEYYYDQKITKDNAGVFYIYPVEAFTPYYIKILSVSTLGVSQHLEDEDVEEYTHTILKSKPGKVRLIEAISRGNDGYSYGMDFSFRWAPFASYGDDETDNEVSLEHTKNTAEDHKYYVQIFLDYPDTVKINNVVLRESPVVSFYTAENLYTYKIEDNIQASKNLFAGLFDSKGNIKNKTNYQSWYDNYYGKAYWRLRIRISVIDTYSQESVYNEIIVENPKPDMRDKDGNLLPIYSTALKSAIEASWQHPHGEFDITHFYLKYCRVGEWIANTAYLVNDIIISGNTIYKCDVAGTSGGTMPSDIANELDTGGLITDNTAKWSHYNEFADSIFGDDSSTYRTKLATTTTSYPTLEFRENTEVIFSLINVGSSDTDVENATYTKTIERLDPKYKYLIGVCALDIFGKRGQSLEYAWAAQQPGQTEDDEEEQIAAPGIPSLAGISEPLANSPEIMYDGSTLNRLRMTWKNEDEDENEYTDIDYFVIQFFGIAKPDAVLGDFPSTESAIGDAIDNGYVTIDALNYIFTLDEITKDQQSGSKTRAYLSGAVSGTTYYARVKAVNTSGQSSGWTTITADTMEAIEGDITGVVMSSVTGETTSPTTVTVTKLSESLKIEVDISDAPDDLWGAKFAVKEDDPFTYTANSADGVTERNNLKTAEISAKEGKVVYYFSGEVGKDYYVSVMPLDNSKNPAKVDGSASWLDATENPYRVAGITNDSFGYSFKKFKYLGSLTSSAYNKVTWSSANLKVKGNTTQTYAITGKTNQTVTGDMILGWIKTDETNFQLINYTDFFSDSAYADFLAIARVSENGNTNQKAVIIDYEGDDFSISSSMISANAIETGHLQAGSVDATKISVSSLSAISGDLGTITAGTVTGTTLRTASINPKIEITNTNGFRAYRSDGGVVAQINLDGSGYLGSSSNFSWTTAGTLSVNGAYIQDSTITGGKISDNTVTVTKLEDSIVLPSGNSISSGQSSYDSGTGFYLGNVSGTPKFSIGNSSGNKLTWDGTNVTVLGNYNSATSLQRIVISSASNDIKFYGNRGDGTTEELANIGINSYDGDYTIGRFGSVNSGNSRRAIVALSRSNIAVSANSYCTTYTMYVKNESSGEAIYASCSGGTGRVMVLYGNTNYAPLRLIGQSGIPSNAAAGDIAFDSSVNKFIGYTGSTWVAFH